jgi:hypothetical protein
VLLRILDNRPKLIVMLIISVLAAFEVQRYVIYPIESLLNFEITQYASMVYLPAGVIFLSFYLLRWWFLPVILIGRTYISLQLGPAELILDMMIFNLVVALLYPLWLYLLNNANWDVFGDVDKNQLTITGAMIFALLLSFSTGILSAINQTVSGVVPLDQALQYTLHFIIGDTIGTGVILFLFYQLLKLNLKWRKQKNG